MSSPAITNPARGPNGTSADRALRGLATVADAAALTQSTTASIDADAFKGLSIAVENSVLQRGTEHRRRHCRFPGIPAWCGYLRIRQRLDRFDAPGRGRSRGRSCSANPARGKGNVVRRMSADVDADVYAMADGDGHDDYVCSTYAGSAASDQARRHGRRQRERRSTTMQAKGSTRSATDLRNCFTAVCSASTLATFSETGDVPMLREELSRALRRI